MKLTRSQQEELEVWEYFIPDNCEWLAKNDEDIKKFFEWSERGKHRDEYFKNGQPNSYFQALIQGKTWAGRNWQMYEEGVLEGTMPYYDILGGLDKTPIPRSVVNQMKREMFKGKDAEIIENTYQMILNNK